MTVDSHELSDYDGCPERLFLFTMGNLVWSYVNAKKSQTHLSVEYTPLFVEMADISQALSESSPTIDVTLDADAAMVQQFIPYMPVLPIRVRVFRHHVDDADNDYKVEMIGEIVSAQFDEEEGTCNLSCRMVASNLDRKVPWPQYQKPCNYALYGPGCRVPKDDYKTTAVALSILNDRMSAPEFGAKASLEGDPKWYVNGFVTCPANGETRFVIDQEDDVLFLQSPFVFTQNGDTVDAFAGCDRSRQTCTVKFDNLDRMLGFPWPPEKNPFRDNVYGTGAPGGSGMSAQQEAALNAAAARGG